MQKLLTTLLLTLCLITGSPGTLHARTLEGINLPDTISASGESLILNGAGVRTATIFGIRVYVMGLYLPEPVSSADAIVESATTKRIFMQFMRGVSASKLRSAWEDGIANNYGNNPSVLKHLQAFNAHMVDVEEGDTFVLTFSGTESVLSINKKERIRIDSREFQKALLLIWLGKNPPNDALKTGILGQKG